MTPNVFISYSWDSEEHKQWIKCFAERLRSDGVNAQIDHWGLSPGEQLPVFMERQLTINETVLIICTPEYKYKSENRLGGVGYEGNIIAAEVFNKGNHEKYITVIKEGTEKTSVPHALSGKFHIFLNSENNFEIQYNELLKTLYKERDKAPPIGEKPDFSHPPQEKISYGKLQCLSNTEILDIVEYFERKVQLNSNDDDALFWIGMCYLTIKSYDLSIKRLQRCVDISNTNAEYFYNFSLALCKGKRPFRLKINEIKNVLSFLYTAISLNENESKFYYFIYIINEDYYEKIGAKSTGMSSALLLSHAKNSICDSYELERLISTLNIVDGKILNNIKCH